MGAGNYESLKTAGRPSHAADDLSFGALDKTSPPPYEILLSIPGRHAKGVDRLTLIMIDREGIV